MLKKTISILSLGLLCLSLNNLSEAADTTTLDNTIATKEIQATEETAMQNSLRELEQFTEKIALEEMHQRLKQHTLEDELFIKVNDRDVLILKNVIANPSLQKQLIYLLPEGKIQHFYTNNKKTADSMSKMLRHFQNEIIDINGYRIVTDKDNVPKDKMDPTYHFWCIKLKYARIINRTYSYGYPAVWGWGWNWDYWHHPIIIHRGHGGHHGRPHHGRR